MDDPQLPKTIFSSRSALIAQLGVLDKAISILHDDIQVASSSSGKGVSLLNKGSIVVNSSNKHLFDVCAECQQEVEQRNLRIHTEKYCPCRIVSCTNPGCGLAMQSQELENHIRNECAYSVHRSKLANSSMKRLKESVNSFTPSAAKAVNFPPPSPATATAASVNVVEVKEPSFSLCEQCGESVKTSKLPLHVSEHCNFRPVLCPNYGVGCNNLAVSLADLQNHLLHECEAEKIKAKMIANSDHRTEIIVCPTCGKNVALGNLRHHETEKCENRLVQCRNSHLGCLVLIPMIERHLHENVDENYERSAIFFGGHCSRVSLDEGDISGPWTSEFWVYRSLAQESLKVCIKNVFLLLSSYETAYCSELLIHENVNKLTQVLKGDGGSDTKANKADNAQLQQDLMQQKLNMINELQGLIPVYSEAMLAYVRAFQSIAISIEAALDCLSEIPDFVLDQTLFPMLPGLSSGDSWDLKHLPPEGFELKEYPDNEKLEAMPILLGKSFLCVFFRYCNAVRLDDGELITSHRLQLETVLEFSQIPDSSFARFLIELIVWRPREKLFHQIITIRSWKLFVNCIGLLLKADFDKLLSLRIQAGLLSPDMENKSSTTKVDNAEDKEQKEKSKKKKDKEKQRRELKKLMETKSDNEAGPGELQPSKAAKLSARILEVIKGGCGFDILNESTTISSDGTQNHLCLQMLSGFSILYLENEKQKKRDDGSYDSMISKADLSRLIDMKEKFGFISAAVKGSLMSAILGNQACFFNVKIRRGVWSHIALVSTEDNKVIGYYNGAVCGTFKDAAFPLPMHSVGGSGFSLHSFCGVVLDVRYWNYSRSSSQIANNMHKLINLSIPGASGTNNNLKKKSKAQHRAEDAGLIAWWTCEDGAPFDSVSDITRHRFKSRFQSTMLFDLHHFSTQMTRFAVPDQLLRVLPWLHWMPMVVWINPLIKLTSPQWVKAESINLLEISPSSNHQLTQSKRSSTKKQSSASKRNNEIEISSNKKQVDTNEITTKLPVPSFREQNYCPFELRRNKLAKRGRDLHRYKLCPLGCADQVKVFQMRFHLHYLCPNRIIKCRFEFCPSFFPYCQQSMHEQTDCAVVQTRQNLLEQAEMHNSATVCPQCGEEMKVRELPNHLDNMCQQRLVFCTHDDCIYGKKGSIFLNGSVEESFEEEELEENDDANAQSESQIPAHLLAHHLKYECTSKAAKHRYVLIERSRHRHPYPRPWGICIDCDSIDDT